MASRCCGVALALISTFSEAHSFTEPYLLPVPFWLYVYACAATLVVTFAALGYLFSGADTGPTAKTWQLPSIAALHICGRCVLYVLRACALGGLLLTIVAGFIGTGDPTWNINMPLFWVMFLLGFTYLTVIAGDLFELISPYATLVAWIERWAPDFARGRVRYPRRLGYYPAFAFYVALIWIELFVLPKPFTLSAALLFYSLLTLGGVFLFGRSDWFRYGEVFGVLFRLVALVAPVEYARISPNDRWHLRLRPPLFGARVERPEHMGLVLFILFMLSSTSYDAIHETELWTALYWQHLIFLAQPLWGTDMVKAQNTLMPWYVFYNRAGLLLSPFAYLALYVSMLECARRLSQAAIPLRELVLEFAPSLIPIAIVYNMTHYYTMLVTQLGKFVRIATDPFGFGWNLFALGIRDPVPPLDMAFVWHTQVALILIGHLASVYLAHVAALRVFPSRRQAILSQIPLLLLMIVYTAIGLYILSLPLAVPMLRED